MSTISRIVAATLSVVVLSASAVVAAETMQLVTRRSGSAVRSHQIVDWHGVEPVILTGGQHVYLADTRLRPGLYRVTASPAPQLYDTPPHSWPSEPGGWPQSFVPHPYHTQHIDGERHDDIAPCEHLTTQRLSVVIVRVGHAQSCSAGQLWVLSHHGGVVLLERLR